MCLWWATRRSRAVESYPIRQCGIGLSHACSSVFPTERRVHPAGSFLPYMRGHCTWRSPAAHRLDVSCGLSSQVSALRRDLQTIGQSASASGSSGGRRPFPRIWSRGAFRRSAPPEDPAGTRQNRCDADAHQGGCQRRMGVGSVDVQAQQILVAVAASGGDRPTGAAHAATASTPAEPPSPHLTTTVAADRRATESAWCAPPASPPRAGDLHGQTDQLELLRQRPRPPLGVDDHRHRVPPAIGTVWPLHASRPPHRTPTGRRCPMRTAPFGT